MADLVFFFKVDLLIFVIAPSSALITGSLTPSVIGDRPSHPISTLSSQETFLSPLTIICIGTKARVDRGSQECGHVSAEPVLLHRARCHGCLPAGEKVRARYQTIQHTDAQFTQHRNAATCFPSSSIQEPEGSQSRKVAGSKS